jgi:hypothetical protein
VLTADGHVQSATAGTGTSGKKCLDVDDCKVGPHIAVDMYACMNTTNKCGAHENQKFKLVPVQATVTGSADTGAGSGSVKREQADQAGQLVTITNDVAGACLTATAGGLVEAQPCADASSPSTRKNQQWTVEATAAAAFSSSSSSSSSGTSRTSSSSGAAPASYRIKHASSASTFDCLDASGAAPTPPPPSPTPAPTPPAQVWAKPLASPAGAYAVALLNRGNAPASIGFDFKDLPPHPAKSNGAGAGASASAGAVNVQYDVLDLWDEGASIGKHTGTLSANVTGTAAAFYKLVPSVVYYNRPAF